MDTIDQALKAGIHRIGSHSDDYGGEADMPCNCEIKKAIASLINDAVIDELECHAKEWVVINEDGTINPTAVHDRIKELKEVQ